MQGGLELSAQQTIDELRSGFRNLRLRERMEAKNLHASSEGIRELRHEQDVG